MKRLHRTLLGVALAGLAASSLAATVTVRFDDPIFNGVPGPGPSHDNVKITYPPKVGGNSQPMNTSAGRFQGTVLAYEGVAKSIFVDGLNDLFMYCYDVYERIGGGSEVTYKINLDGEHLRTLDFLGAVNQVLNQGKPKDDPYAWLHPGSGAVAAAIQLGIWESKYDTDGWDIAHGGFTAAHLSSATSVALASFFSAVDDSASLHGKYVMTLEVEGAQDMIAGDPPPADPAPMPEPGTLALLGIAAAGLMATRRRAVARPTPP